MSFLKDMLSLERASHLTLGVLGHQADPEQHKPSGWQPKCWFCFFVFLSVAFFFHTDKKKFRKAKHKRLAGEFFCTACSFGECTDQAHYEGWDEGAQERKWKST